MEKGLGKNGGGASTRNGKTGSGLAAWAAACLGLPAYAMRGGRCRRGRAPRAPATAAAGGMQACRCHAGVVGGAGGVRTPAAQRPPTRGGLLARPASRSASVRAERRGLLLGLGDSRGDRPLGEEAALRGGVAGSTPSPCRAREADSAERCGAGAEAAAAPAPSCAQVLPAAPRPAQGPAAGHGAREAVHAPGSWVCAAGGPAQRSRPAFVRRSFAGWGVSGSPASSWCLSNMYSHLRARRSSSRLSGSSHSMPARGRAMQKGLRAAGGPAGRPWRWRRACRGGSVSEARQAAVSDWAGRHVARADRRRMWTRVNHRLPRCQNLLARSACTSHSAPAAESEPMQCLVRAAAEPGATQSPTSAPARPPPAPRTPPRPRPRPAGGLLQAGWPAKTQAGHLISVEVLPSGVGRHLRIHGGKKRPAWEAVCGGRHWRTHQCRWQGAQAW